MKITKIFEWLAMLFVALVLLFAGLGLLILGNIGISSVVPTIAAGGAHMSWLYSVTYWFIFASGIILFMASLVIFFRIIKQLVTH